MSGEVSRCRRERFRVLPLEWGERIPAEVGKSTESGVILFLIGVKSPCLGSSSGFAKIASGQVSCIGRVASVQVFCINAI